MIGEPRTREHKEQENKGTNREHRTKNREQGSNGTREPPIEGVSEQIESRSETTNPRSLASDCRPPAPDHRPPIELLEGLVRIPSVSGDERAAAAWLVQQMAALGYDASIDEAGNAVGVLGEGRPETVLLGHIDTTPGAIPVRIEGGRLYGRGSVDAKGPLATFVVAAARLQAAGRLRGRIVVIGCVEEEAPSSRGAHAVVERYQPDACIVGEPSRWDRVTLGYKGSLRLRWRVEQDCGHTAHDRQTSAGRICDLWQQLQRYAAHYNDGQARAFDQLLPQLLQINSAGDGLREWSVAEISVRLPPELAPETVIETLRSFDPLAELEVLGATPAFQAARNNPVARALTLAIRQQDAQPALLLKTGTADMNVVGPAWRCPIVAYGPGDAALDHTPDEHIELDEYLRAIEALTAALAQLHR
jgi:LysW-gamma-L-lysine carboxypeptidase